MSSSLRLQDADEREGDERRTLLALGPVPYRRQHDLQNSSKNFVSVQRKRKDLYQKHKWWDLSTPCCGSDLRCYDDELGTDETRRPAVEFQKPQKSKKSILRPDTESAVLGKHQSQSDQCPLFHIHRPLISSASSRRASPLSATKSGTQPSPVPPLTTTSTTLSPKTNHPACLPGANNVSLASCLASTQSHEEADYSHCNNAPLNILRQQPMLQQSYETRSVTLQAPTFSARPHAFHRSTSTRTDSAHRDFLISSVGNEKPVTLEKQGGDQENQQEDLAHRQFGNVPRIRRPNVSDEKRRRRRLGALEQYDANVRAYLGALQPDEGSSDNSHSGHLQFYSRAANDLRPAEAQTSSNVTRQGFDSGHEQQVVGPSQECLVDSSILVQRQDLISWTASSLVRSSTVEKRQNSVALSERSPPIGDILAHFPCLVTPDGDRKLDMRAFIMGSTRRRGLMDTDAASDSGACRSSDFDREEALFSDKDDIDKDSVTSSDIDKFLIEAAKMSFSRSSGANQSLGGQVAPTSETQMRLEHRDRYMDTCLHRSLPSARVAQWRTSPSNAPLHLSSSTSSTKEHRKRDTSSTTANTGHHSSPPSYPPPPTPVPAIPRQAEAGMSSIGRAIIANRALKGATLAKFSGSGTPSSLLNLQATSKRTTAPARV